MPLMPERVKYRKMHRGNRAGLAWRGSSVAFGEYGLQALERCWLDTKQIEAARVAISRAVKKGGKIYVRIFPDHPFTKKPAETRMGTGKGGVEGWVAVVKPGRVIFEVEGVSIEIAKEAFHRAHHKLSVKTQLISREPVL